MSQVVMVDRDMVAPLGPECLVYVPGSDERQPVGPIDAKGMAEAPFTGPAAFRLPIVLPKAGRLVSCEIKVSVSHAGRIDFAGVGTHGLDPGDGQIALLRATGTAQGAAFEIPELAFQDFVDYGLVVQVDAPANEKARLGLTATINYRLPEESAADYLNYIMTQA